jgi:hypothetical protein
MLRMVYRSIVVRILSPIRHPPDDRLIETERPAIWHQLQDKKLTNGVGCVRFCKNAGRKAAMVVVGAAE